MLMPDQPRSVDPGRQRRQQPSLAGSSKSQKRKLFTFGKKKSKKKMLFLHGNLHDEPFESVHMKDAFFNVKKMLATAQELEKGLVPSTYGRDSFIFVFNAATEHVYFFPGIESENLDDDASRVKKGVAFFVERGFTAYSYRPTNRD